MAGYSIKIVEEKDRIEKYTCGYCKLLLKEPHQNKCGHLFCKLCVDALTRATEPRNCPTCTAEGDPELNSIIRADTCFRDNALRKEMKRLNTKCHNQGCVWRGPFGEYEEHEPICKFGLISCPNDCGRQIKRGDSNKHAEKECTLRLIRCRDCGSNLQFKNLKRHIVKCPDREINCEFCGLKILRKQIADHIDVNTGNCPKKLQYCKYREIGCEKMVEFGKEQDHSAKYLEKHLGMVYGQVATLLNIRSQANENATKTQQLNNTVQKHEDVIVNLRRSLEQIQNDLEAMPRLAKSEASTSSLKISKP
ncbi:TNF receptor-associated factor 2-like isoform X1 [Ptychodera flava]|uniref:TNF receptor-associated factor 2-like isoform X1 n=1 Tax=Ptychodera flava TaxID=63121 RepID=UPI00396A7587